MTTGTRGLAKRATGIAGLDHATRGGLPAGGAVLVVGEAGSGKTVFGLNLLAAAARRGEGGLFLTFEQSREQLLRDAASFSWGESLQDSPHCAVLDARTMPRADGSGAFEINGLLAVIGAYAERIQAQWVVLDGIDHLLGMHPDHHAAVAQVAEINDWCEARSITLLLTGKSAIGAVGVRDGFSHGAYTAKPDRLEGVEYLLSTMFVLSGWLSEQRLNRRFRIAKYRGTAHETDEMALLIDSDGVHLPYGEPAPSQQFEASSERITTGIEALDNVLAGGLYRGSTTLISGQPGTAKTTLAVAFAEATARSGERALYVSFDESPAPIMRNARTLGLDLQPHIDHGLLRLHARTAWSSLIEEHYLALLKELTEYEPACLVIDPVSAILKAGGTDNAFRAVERLLAHARARGVTTILTSLSEDDDPVGEKSLSHTSTVADNWIMLRYQVLGGERNRSLSVVKSRGTGHSNQVRELLLSDAGVELAEVYRYGTDVLMGTARTQKESEERERLEAQATERAHRRRELEREIENARLRLENVEGELSRLLEAREAHVAAADRADSEQRAHEETVRRRRQPAGGSPDPSGGEPGAGGRE